MRGVLIAVGDLGMWLYRRLGWEWGYGLYESCWAEINDRWPEK